MDRRSWALLYALAGVWGASYLFIKIGLDDFSPVWVAFGRSLFAALVIFPFAMRRGALRGIAARWRVIAVLALAQAVIPFTLIAWGQEEVPTALTGILIASAPLYTAVLAIWVDHDERVGGVRLAGLMIGLVGVVALVGLDLSGSSAALVGAVAILAGTVGYAAGGLILKHHLHGESPVGVVAAIMVASTVMLAPLAAFTAPDQVPSAGPVAAVVILGLLGTGVAFVVFYRLVHTVGPGKALIVSYIAPGFAVVYGALLLDEAITAGTLIGLAMILAGSWIAAEGGLRRRRAPDVPQGELELAVGGISPGEAAAAAAARRELR